MKSDRKGKQKRPESAKEPTQVSVEGETQFISQDDDDDNLWDAEAILEERHNRYLIRWKGVDQNGKPWEDSWVAKFDVTNDLIQDWKRKKSAKKKRKSKGKQSNGSSQPYNPPNPRLSRRSEETSSNTLSRRSTRQSRTSAPNSVSTTRSASLAKVDVAVARMTKKRKQPKDEMESSGEDTGVNPSPRKKRRVSDAQILMSSSSPPQVQPSPVKGWSKSRPSMTSVDIYDELPQPPSPIASTSRQHREQVKRRLQRLVKKKASGRNFTGEEEEEEEEEEEVEEVEKEEEEESASDAGPSRITRDEKEGIAEVQQQGQGQRADSEHGQGGSDRGGEGEDGGDEYPVEKKTKGLAKGLKVTSVPSRSSSLGPPPELSRHSPNDPQNLQGVAKRPRHMDASGNRLDGDADDEQEHVDFDAINDTDDIFHSDVDNPPLRQTIGEGASHVNNEKSIPIQPNVRKTSHYDPEEKNQSETGERHLNDEDEGTSKLDQDHSQTGKDPTPADNSVGTVIPETQTQTSKSISSRTEDSSQHGVPSEPKNPLALLNGQDETISEFTPSKPLKPIPVVTPSKFHPHLKRTASITVRAAAVHTLMQQQHVPLSSSIETDFSPIKDAESGESHEAVRGDDTNLDGVDDEIEDSLPLSLRLKARGLELAEMDLMQRRARLQTGPKRPLSLITNNRDARAARPQSPIAFVDDDVVQQMEDAYMDLDGGANVEKVHDGADTSVIEIEEEPMSQPVGRTVVEESELDPHVTIDEHASLTTKPSRLDENHGRQPHTPARPKPLDSPKKLNAAPILTSPTRQLNSALGLLNKKSEEIHALKTRLGETDDEKDALSARIAQLMAENQALRLQHADPAASVSQKEISALCKEREDALRERDSALEEVLVLRNAKEGALEDVAFIRKQYDMASSRAQELSVENGDLSSRALIAEKQVTHGVALIRNQYDARLARLNVDLNKAHSLIKILTEKDKRTDDEVRRQAASVPKLDHEIKYLKEVVGEQKAELRTLVKHRNSLLITENDFKTECEELRMENTKYQDELLRLSVEVARYAARERSIKKMINLSSPPDNDPDIETDPADDDEIYPCNWTIDGSSQRCSEVFTSIEDLEDHLFLTGHV